MNDKSNSVVASSPTGASTATGASTGTRSTTSSAATSGGSEAPLKSAAIETGRELARDAKHIADDLVDHAKHTVDSRVSSSKDRAALTLGSVAEALRHTGGHLKLERATEGLSGYVGQAADQVERASKYIKTRTMGELVGDVEHFARREPALFLGGAFIAGLVGGRFLKSSAPRVSPQSGSRTQGGEHRGGSGARSSQSDFGPRTHNNGHSKNESPESGGSGSGASYASSKPGSESGRSASPVGSSQTSKSESGLYGSPTGASQSTNKPESESGRSGSAVGSSQPTNKPAQPAKSTGSGSV